MRELADIQADWDRAARENAFYNILTIPGLSEEEFWDRGRREVGELLERFGHVGSVLDFGCGIGRLTQAFAAVCDSAEGVDISPEMIRLARIYNRHVNCAYFLNETDDLSAFGDDEFDLVYSTIVLQHLPPHLARGYVREFLRVSRGHVVFQLPEGRTSEAGALSMYGTRRAEVESWLDGAELLDVQTNDASGVGFTSYQYTMKA